MELPHSSASTRYVGPTTPEPFASTATEELRQPSPPRPRLRLKKRNPAHLSAPTQQFLASVAAADVPIPSIEGPEIAFHDSSMTDLFPDKRHLAEEDINFLSLRGRAFSPPKTPAPGVVPSLSPSRYPNWSIDSSFSSSTESTPDRDCISSRPSTARSTRTSSSIFSHPSQLSDDDHSESFEDSFKSVVGSPRKLSQQLHQPQPSQQTSLQPRKAPWTKPMDAHLWATYVLYLQDPKVTPFRLSKSCIPPHGVLTRVAREAKKSWKGAKALTKASAPQAVDPNASKSGSSTPTGESTFIAWPHTTSATRNHLRDLCKLKASTPGARHGMSRSPTPFTQAASRHWNRRSTPRTSVFRTRDMAMSLTMSTAQTMQPDGPLAQLAASSSDNSIQSISSYPSGPSVAESSSADLAASELASFAERRRLGSPFSARSYGPSASASLAAVLGLNTSRQSHTIGPRRTLRSPVRMARLTTIHKRRTKQSEESRKRPTLDSDVFTDPSQSGSSLGAGFSPTGSLRVDELFVPQMDAEPALGSTAAASLLSPPQLLTPDVPPRRLGSPFSGSSTSFSFPNRFSQPTNFDLGGLGRPFATVQQSGEPAPAALARTNLASRLAYIDQRLKEFNRGSRSGSPA